MTDTALLIIDMQKAMFPDPKKQPADGAAVLQNICLLLKNARERDIPVIFVQHTVCNLLVAGMQSDVCVKASCLGALAHGYHVTLVSDAHSTFPGLFTDGRHTVEKSGRALAKKGVTLRTTKQVFA